MDNPRVRATHQHLYAAANGHSHPYPTHSHSHSYGSAPQTTRNLSASVPQQSPLQSPSQSQSHSQIIRRSHAPAPLQIPNQNYRSSPSHSPLMSPLMSPNSQILHRQASFTRKAGAGAGAGSGAGARFSPQQITDASATLFFQTANVPAAVNRHSPATSMRGSTISNGSSGRNGYGNGTSAPVSPQIPQTSPYGGLRKHEEENEVEDEFDDDGNPIKREPELNQDDYDPHQPYPPEKDEDYDQHGGYYDHAGYYHIDGGFYDDYACYHVYGDYDGYYDSDGFYRTYNEDDAAAAEQAAAEEKHRMQQALLQRERERLYYEQQQRRVMQGETMLNTSRANCSLIQLFTEMTTSSNETSKTGKTRKKPSPEADYRNDYKHQPAEETALYLRPHDPSPRVAGRMCCGPRNTPAPSSSPNPYISPHQHNPTRSVGTTYTRTSSDSASLSVPTRRISRMCTPEPVSSNREGFGRGFDLPVSPSPVKQNQRSRKHILQ